MIRNTEYEEIIQNNRPAIIIHFHFNTDGDFSIRLDENGKGIYSGIEYECENETIDFKNEDIIISNPDNDKLKIYIEAIHKIKDIYNELVISYDRTEYIYNWFKEAIDWLTSDNIAERENEFYLSGNYDMSYIRIILKDIILFKPLDSVYMLNADTEDYVTRGLLVNQNVYGSTIRYIQSHNHVVEKTFQNNDVFSTEEEAITEAKKRISADITYLQDRIDEYKHLLNDLKVSDKVNKVFEDYYTNAKKNYEEQKEKGNIDLKKKVLSNIKEKLCKT